MCVTFQGREPTWRDRYKLKNKLKKNKTTQCKVKNIREIKLEIIIREVIMYWQVVDAFMHDKMIYKYMANLRTSIFLVATYNEFDSCYEDLADNHHENG